MNSKFYEKQISEDEIIVGQFSKVHHPNGMYFIAIYNGSSTLHTEFVNRSKEGFESMKNLVERYYAEALLKAGR